MKMIVNIHQYMINIYQLYMYHMIDSQMDKNYKSIQNYLDNIQVNMIDNQIYCYSLHNLINNYNNNYHLHNILLYIVMLIQYYYILLHFGFNSLYNCYLLIHMDLNIVYILIVMYIVNNIMNMVGIDMLNLLYLRNIVMSNYYIVMMMSMCYNYQGMGERL